MWVLWNRLVRAWLDKEKETLEGCAAYQHSRFGLFLPISVTLPRFELMAHCNETLRPYLKSGIVGTPSCQKWKIDVVFYFTQEVKQSETLLNTFVGYLVKMKFGLFAVALVFVVVLSVYKFYTGRKSQKHISTNSKFLPPVITPVSADFKWEQTEPYPYRPFKKGPYNMTLALKKLDPNDYITLENTYLDRIALREKLFDETQFYACDDSAVGALKEMYRFIFDFLVKKYPQYFVLTEKETLIHNTITGKFFSSDPADMKKEEILRLIATNIEEDMLIMLKNPSTDQLDEYILRSFITLMPAGFNPMEKLNKSLTAIHGPVPGYLQKLQISMNKFFSRVQPHEFIVRQNWSLQTHSNLCAPKGSHATKEEAEKLHPLFPNDLDFNKCFFRVEKQCVTRLPESGAIMMIVRTYTTSLMDLRADLSEEQKDIMCSAIDGISGDLALYKRRVIWGDAAKSFIRGESNGSQPIPRKHVFVH